MATATTVSFICFPSSAWQSKAIGHSTTPHIAFTTTKTPRQLFRFVHAGPRQKDVPLDYFRIQRDSAQVRRQPLRDLSILRHPKTRRKLHTI